MAHAIRSPFHFSTISLLVGLLMALAGTRSVFGQSQIQEVMPVSTRVVNYKVLFDDPYQLNRLWLHFSPLMLHASGSNSNMGFGIQPRFFLGKSVQLSGSFFQSYGRGTDFTRNQALNNAGIVQRLPNQRRDINLPQTNTFNSFSNWEATGQYHIFDKEIKSTSKVMLTSRKVRISEFSTVDNIIVNSKNRSIFSARAGGGIYASAVSLAKPMQKANASLPGPEGAQLLPNGSSIIGGIASATARNQLYSNLRYGYIHVGGSYQYIRNVSIRADKFGNLANNIIVTGYSDILLAPNPVLDNVTVAQAQGPPITFSTEGLKTSNIGARAGFEVFYNQDLHYAFGGEVGVRPGLRGQGFYFMARVSFPSLSFNFHRSRIANQTN
jgi:hypothetical protein